MHKNFPRIAAACAALCLAALASCATAIPVQLTKPAMFDMRGVKRLAVLPFGFADSTGRGILGDAFYRFSPDYYWHSDFERKVAAEITNSITDQALATGAFTVISSSEVAKATFRGGDYSAVADAFLTGDVTVLSVDDKPGTEPMKGADGIVRPVQTVTRTVNLEFIYRLIRASDGSIIGQMRKSGSASEKKMGLNAYALLPDAFGMARGVINGQMGGIAHEIAPWQTTEYRGLASDKTKDPRMKDADAMAKKGQYAQADAIFQSVYAENGNFAAGFNHAIMVEVMGDLDGAIALMKDLAAKTGDSKASGELRRMQATKAEAEKLAASK